MSWARPWPAYVPAPFSLQALLAKDLPAVRWAIPGIVPEGVILLAGKPKLGKSWLALSLAFAIAAGGIAMGEIPVIQGQVLYLALEDNQRRLQSRAKQLLASMSGVPNGIEFELNWPRLNQGGLKHIEEYVQTHPNLRLIIIDTWAKVSPRTKGSSRSQYEEDYQALTPLKNVVDACHISVLLIHHLRKMRADDLLDEITGSIGVTGAVDGVLVLKRERGQSEATLFVTGRDVEQERQVALTFDSITATWSLVGDSAHIVRTKERQEILELLTHTPAGMTPRQVADVLGKNYHTIRSLLRKMEEGCVIQHVNNLYFAIVEDQPPERVEKSLPHTTDDIDYSDNADDGTVSKPSPMQQHIPLRRDAQVQWPSADHLVPAEDRPHERVSTRSRNQRHQA
jgi:predicted transcriptional regulator